MGQEQTALWRLVYATLNPKPKETPAECLSRLTNERLPEGIRIEVNPETAEVREEKWSNARLVSLERKHMRSHDFDDDRQIIVFESKGRNILIDGNHRVTRWLAEPPDRDRAVLIISLKGQQNGS